MEQYNVTGMSCAACSARVEKAVSKVPGVTSCSVSLLTNSMGVEGTADPAQVIAAVEEADGAIVPRIKISENVGKITNPHFKKVYRFYGLDSGMAEADYICLHSESVDDTRPLVIRDPEATWKQKTMTNFTARELQVPIFRGGELVYDMPTLPEIQAYCKKEVATLWPEVRRFDYPHNYYVDLSDELLGIKNALLNARS